MSTGNDRFLTRLIRDQVARLTTETDLSQERIGEIVAQATVDALHQSVPAVVRSLDRDRARMLREHRKLDAGFHRRLWLVWGDALDHYYTAYVACLEAGENHRNALARQPDAEDWQRVEALTRLHARGCAVTSETFALLCTGHPAGAEARSRTLHELAVVAELINRGDEDLAERLLLHAYVERAKQARTYEAIRERIDGDAIDLDVLESVQRELSDLLARYGNAYGRDWGWALPLFPPGRLRVTFKDLEELANFDHLRPSYMTGSHRTHAGSMGLALGVSEFRGQEQYQVGATNSGLEEAGHGPLFSLLSITLCLLLAGIEDDPEALMVMEILGVLVERAGQEFEAASLRVAQLEEDYLAAMNRGPSSLMVFHGRRRLELMAGKLARRAREARSVGAWWLRDLRIRQHRRARDTKVDESSQPGRAQD